MSSFDLSKITEKVASDKGYWNSFLEQPDFELGVMYLKPGQEDVQTPHSSDEVYFIVEGDGILTIDGKDHQVRPHTALVVPKNTPHNFHSNTKPIVAYYVLN